MGASPDERTGGLRGLVSYRRGHAPTFTKVVSRTLAVTPVRHDALVTRQQWSRVLGTASVLLVLAACIISPSAIFSVVWSDFAQRVYVSLLGTVGALAVGLGLFFLKLEHDRKTEADKRLQDRQDRYQEEMLTLLTEHRAQVHETNEAWRPDVFRLSVASLSLRLMDYGNLIQDESTSNLSRTMAITLSDWSARLVKETDGFSPANGMRYVAYCIEASHQVAVHMRDGSPINVNRFAAIPSLVDYFQNDSEKPDTSKETPG